LITNPSFAVGDLYSSDEIQKSLGVGNAGGVRASVCEGVVRRLVIMTSLIDTKLAKENPYHDRIEGQVLVYTGAGRQGDQSLGGVNSRIPQQASSRFPIYGFEIVGSRRDKQIGPQRWRFIGLLEYLRHYPDSQIDAHGAMRQVWVFEFQIHREPEVVPTLNDQAISSGILLDPKTKSDVIEEDREVVSGPAEQNEDREDKQSLVLLEEVRSRLLMTTPRQFELVVQEMLLKSGFERAEVTRYSQDGGIDVNAFAGRNMWPIQNLLLQVQAKRWLHSVGRKEVAELRGSLQPFARGAVVTTSHFSKAAIREASEPGKNPIVLLDGQRFAALISRTEVDWHGWTRG
jgi:Restriction endonuclease